MCVQLDRINHLPGLSPYHAFPLSIARLTPLHNSIEGLPCTPVYSVFLLI